MSKLGGAPCLAHAAEADAVAEGRSEPVQDDAEQVVRKFGPWTAVPPRSFLGRWHDMSTGRDYRRHARRQIERDLGKQLNSATDSKRSCKATQLKSIK
jgi:hypothetical protein